MTRRERVRKAIRHEQPDRVPWTFPLAGPALAKLADHYDDLRLADHQFFEEWAGNHFRSVGPRGKGQFHGLEEEIEPGLWRDGWGVIWDTRGLYGEGEWGRPVNCVLPEPTLAHYTFPDPPGSEDYGHYPQFIEDNRDYFIVGMEGHLFEAAWALRGMEDFLMDMALNPGFVDDLLDRVTEYYMAAIEQSVKYDIDAFAFGDDWGSQSMGLIMGPRHWRRYFKPRLARMFARIKAAGKFVHLHSDGQVVAIFEDLIEIGLDVYNPFQPEIMDVYDLKRKYGDRLCFHGGIGVQALLPFGTPQQVKAEAQRMIREVGTGGGYILAPAHAVLADIPAENMLALIEAVQEQ
ncbi:MAG: uroporphyrinogen decarboxylase family protein [Chloroflexota bacterium]